MNFFEQNWASFDQGGDVVEGTGANDAVLQPAIRALNFSFGLCGQGVDHIGVHEGEDLSPLGVDVVGSQDQVLPQAIPMLDKAKDP